MLRRLRLLSRQLAAGQDAGTNKGPLHDVTVIDCTQVIAGPYCAMQLADMGATVIKVENANGVGDSYRRAGTEMKLGSGEKVASSFASVNRGKRSVSLQLKHLDGREALIRLISKADVFVQNWRPGVAERLGLGYEEISARFPRLIYLSISGFGDSGPLVKQPVYDPLIQARAGTVANQHRLNNPAISSTSNIGDAHLVNMLLVDKTTAMTGALEFEPMVQ